MSNSGQCSFFNTIKISVIGVERERKYRHDTADRAVSISRHAKISDSTLEVIYHWKNGMAKADNGCEDIFMIIATVLKSRKTRGMVINLKK